MFVFVVYSYVMLQYMMLLVFIHSVPTMIYIFIILDENVIYCSSSKSVYVV